MDDRLDHIDWSITIYAIHDNAEPMSWNLFLAFIPLVLSCLLFNNPRSPFLKWGVWILLGITIIGSYPRFFRFGEFLITHKFFILIIIGILGYCAAMIYYLRGKKTILSILWWLTVIVFILFLPNAAYILTDFVHLIIDIRKGYPMGTVMLFLIPQYFLFIGTGFQAYTLSIMNLEIYLLKNNQRKIIFIVEIIINFLSAFGVYLGRFARFNTWDVLTNMTKLLKTTQYILFSRHSLVTILVLFFIFMACYRMFKRINIGLMQQKNAFSAF